MSAYTNHLNKQTKLLQKGEKNSLTKRFQDWYSGLPEVTKNRPFAMSEFEAALKTQGKYISPVLLSLGWVRKRRWSSSGQYHRYWMPLK